MHCETGGLRGSLIPCSCLGPRGAGGKKGGNPAAPWGMEGLGKDQTLPGTAWLTISRHVRKSKSS